MNVKLRDVVSLSFLVLSRGMPEEVKLKECSLEFSGNDAMNSTSGLITGVYGAQSKQLALAAASNWTKSHEGSKSKGANRVLMLDVGYRVENFVKTRDQIREDVMRETGWLHMDRLAASYRDEIKEMWIEWIHKDIGALKAADLESQSLTDIALQYPRYVARMMKKDPDIKVVIHPVVPMIDPTSVLRAATVRYTKDRFVDPNIRFLQDVAIVV